MDGIYLPTFPPFFQTQCQLKQNLYEPFSYVVLIVNSVSKHIIKFIKQQTKTKQKIFNDGCLGSHTDEERSEVR